MRSSMIGVLVLASGCVMPRSMVVGQMAAPVGRGATEVGVFTGLQYAAQTDPPYQTSDAAGAPITNQQTRRAFALPQAEANIQYGFDEHFALNVHGSSAGVQPGLKWTINKSRHAHVALLPAVAFGFARQDGVTLAAGVDGVQHENHPTSLTSFTFLGGLKVLVSHRSGFFAAVGYDFVFNRSLSAQVIGTGNVQDRYEALTQLTAHQLSASVGLDIPLGMVRLRPEIAFAVTPGISSVINAGPPGAQTQTAAGGGFSFAVFPGFTLAVASPPRELTEDEKEDEARKVRKRRGAWEQKGEEEEREDESDDEEDEVQRPVKQRRDAEEDDEAERPRERRSTEPDWD